MLIKDTRRIYRKLKYGTGLIGWMKREQIIRNERNIPFLEPESYIHYQANCFLTGAYRVILHRLACVCVYLFILVVIGSETSL